MPSLALLVCAPAAAQDPALPGTSPVADLVATVDGSTVTLDASKSSDPDGTVVSYAWDLDGDGVHETGTGAEPRVERSFPTGTALVASVQVTDDGGATDETTASVEVVGEPEPEPVPVPVPEARVARASQPEPEPSVTAAASGSVTISDFEFGPSTINIGSGDSVTWTNRGPTVHTATANDGSFDSGNLDRGESYTRRFTAAGTYSYICTPHPFMTGRVVVAGSGGGGGGDSGGGDDAGSAGSGTDSDAGAGAGTGSGTDAGSGDLAKTGVDLIAWSLFGFGLFAFGAALRWRLGVTD